EQPGQARGSRRVRALDRRTGPAGDRADAAEHRLPPDEGAEARPPPRGTGGFGVTVLRGEPLGAGRRIAGGAARFNEVVTSRLVEGALAGLARHGVPEGAVHVVWVPG